jgi:threonine dehydrogenase-like Zn-dependent dehydrogenase
VLEAVGLRTGHGIVRAGGVISRVGVPQYKQAPVGFGSLFAPNITLTRGPAPARAYIQTLLLDIPNGIVEPGKVFDREITLDEIPDGYKAMDERTALKVLVRP